MIRYYQRGAEKIDLKEMAGRRGVLDLDNARLRISTWRRSVSAFPLARGGSAAAFDAQNMRPL
jgi:hypothetical protein